MHKELYRKETELLEAIAKDTALIERAKDVDKDVSMASVDKEISLCFNFSIGNSHCFRTIRISRGLARSVLRIIKCWAIGDRVFAEQEFGEL